ncbi:hypothetical protein, partial [Aeromonas hydrophila]|uniref:hypothetical protein n=1 Tax=Aeromonas hydrophila TaxID=644 RepID=UPI003F679307
TQEIDIRTHTLSITSSKWKLDCHSELNKSQQNSVFTIYVLKGKFHYSYLSILEAFLFFRGDDF